MNFRHATPTDAEGIAALHASSWRITYGAVLSAKYLDEVAPSERKAAWAQRLASPGANQCVVVAESAVGLVGFACAFSEEHAQWGSYLENLHVGSSNQGQGVGRALLTNVAQWCECQAPGRGLYLSVNQANQRAQEFYRRLGARNAEAGVWHAPDGSLVPTYWFLWESAGVLAPAAANPSIERTAVGKPPAAAHVER
jgi:ribosomal protein S18 acetylase RimI-like enzyme